MDILTGLACLVLLALVIAVVVAVRAVQRSRRRSQTEQVYPLLPEEMPGGWPPQPTFAPPSSRDWRPIGILGAPTTQPAPKPLAPSGAAFQAKGKMSGGYCFLTGMPKKQCTCEECQRERG